MAEEQGDEAGGQAQLEGEELVAAVGGAAAQEQEVVAQQAAGGPEGLAEADAGGEVVDEQGEGGVDVEGGAVARAADAAEEGVEGAVDGGGEGEQEHVALEVVEAEVGLDLHDGRGAVRRGDRGGVGGLAGAELGFDRGAIELALVHQRHGIARDEAGALALGDPQPPAQPQDLEGRPDVGEVARVARVRHPPQLLSGRRVAAVRGREDTLECPSARPT